jgi:hypothetical protein
MRVYGSVLYSQSHFLHQSVKLLVKASRKIRVDEVDVSACQVASMRLGPHIILVPKKTVLAIVTWGL